MIPSPSIASAPAALPAEPQGAADAAKAKSQAPTSRLDKAAIEALVGVAVPALVKAVRAGTAALSRSRGEVAGYAASGHRTSSPGAKGPLAFLKDPKLSIEEKLMRLLSHLSEKWEKEMQGKLDEMSGAEGAQSSSPSAQPAGGGGGLLQGVAQALSGAFGGSGGAGGAGGGLLQGVLGAFAGAFGGGGGGGAAGAGGGLLGMLGSPMVQGALEKLGGPVLGAAASALGFPAAAPALVKYGGPVLGAVAGAASAFGGAQGNGAAGASGASGTGSKAMSDAKRQQLTLEIQRLYEKQKEMFNLVSNISRISHETRSGVIGNIR